MTNKFVLFGKIPIDGVISFWVIPFLNIYLVTLFGCLFNPSQKNKVKPLSWTWDISNAGGQVISI